MLTQLERLQQDIKELEQYIVRLKRRGDTNSIKKMRKKVDFIQNHLAETHN
jgi:uncharacterized membrane protein (DUF106 family)